MKKDILISVSSKTGMVNLSNTRLGINGENLQGNIIISFSDEFVNGTAIMEVQRGTTKNYIVMTKENETYYLPILSSLLSSVGTVIMQVRITEGTNLEEIPIWKSNSFYLKVEEAINAQATMPEEYPTWLDTANVKLNEIDEAISEVETLDIDVSKSGSVSTVTLTKKDGTEKTVNINDGEKGNKGDTGDKGADAKINGVNTLTIEAGTNISLDQEGNILTINSISSGGTSDYSDLTNKPKINNVELNGNKTLNDLGIQPVGNYLTEETDPTVPSHVKNITQANITSWNNKSDFSGNYNDLTNKPTIPVVPTNVSAFTNDVGYLTQHQDITGKLNTSQVKNTMSTTAGDVYDVRYINTMIGNIETLLGEI